MLMVHFQTIFSKSVFDFPSPCLSNASQFEPNSEKCGVIQTILTDTGLCHQSIVVFNHFTVFNLKTSNYMINQRELI